MSLNFYNTSNYPIYKLLKIWKVYYLTDIKVKWTKDSARRDLPLKTFFQKKVHQLRLLTQDQTINYLLILKIQDQKTWLSALLKLKSPQILWVKICMLGMEFLCIYLWDMKDLMLKETHYPMMGHIFLALEKRNLMMIKISCQLQILLVVKLMFKMILG